MSTPPYEEIWLELPDGQVLQALHNGNVGILLYTCPKGNSFEYPNSLDPKFDGEDDEQIELQLSNGQMDEYPLSWVISLAKIRRALKYFQQKKSRPDFIDWGAQ